jgi:hypothetical protein
MTSIPLTTERKKTEWQTTLSIAKTTVSPTTHRENEKANTKQKPEEQSWQKMGHIHLPQSLSQKDRQSFQAL